MIDMVSQFIYTILLVNSLISADNVALQNVESEFINEYYVEVDKIINSDVHHYILINEKFENDNPNNQHVSLITREYIEVFSEDAEESSYSSTIAIDKVKSIDAARKYLKDEGITFNDGHIKCVISPSMLYKWTREGYVPTEI